LLLASQKPALYEAVSPVTEGCWLVGELESRLSVEGLEAAGALLDAAEQPEQEQYLPCKGCEEVSWKLQATFRLCETG